MARINLLPWREERRKARQKEFVGMLGLAVLAGVVAGDVWTIPPIPRHCSARPLAVFPCFFKQ